ncbi:hypothetical protein JA1_000067 [Spathaspora sp. JA1]|nr:hypothetical protein JA1_000067 [Spathaspora sp. JA1]
MLVFEILLPSLLLLPRCILGEVAAVDAVDSKTVAVAANKFYPEYIYLDSQPIQKYQQDQEQKQEQVLKVSEVELNTNLDLEKKHVSHLSENHHHTTNPGHHNPSTPSKKIRQKIIEKDVPEKSEIIRKYADQLENYKYLKWVKIIISVIIVAWVLYMYVLPKREAKVVEAISYNYYSSKNV